MTRFNTRALSTLAVSAALLAALVGLSGCKSEATTAQEAPAPQVSNNPPAGFPPKTIVPGMRLRDETE